MLYEQAINKMEIDIINLKQNLDVYQEEINKKLNSELEHIKTVIIHN